MSGRSSLVARLFWTTIIGGALAFGFGLPALAATGLVLLYIVLHRLDRPRRFRRAARRLARVHAETLALRRHQECFEDAYGNWIDDGWLRERDYFAERTILPHLDARGFADLADTRWAVVLDIIDDVALSVDLPDDAEVPDDGIAYERFCAEALREAGWSARPTKASGDQGADVVAERAGIRLVLQCKRYTKPVGNAAVQEAAAAARYWQADMAAVVSNAGFTPAARKLSGATGVLLLHHDALRSLSPGRKARRVNAAPA
ncbi:restriction endonuclease [Methylobacterium marchantiae]|uniref:Restriction endonuclease n=1 Tax=Methylobacterium marchantiae TaxID=600331 RepID=A0ABW3X293_9HYPH|nr:hypothetical protein AIGOOFII_2568 [Methylobacterium marchantiae]